MKRKKELEKHVESIQSSYDSTLLLMNEKIQQMKNDIANHEVSIDAHSADVLYQMFGGKDFITKEVAGILSRMLTTQDEHDIVSLSASPFYAQACDTKDVNEAILNEPTTQLTTQSCSTINCYGYGSTWCVQCCYKTPLAPCFLCNDCAANNGEVHKISVKLLRTSRYAKN